MSAPLRHSQFDVPIPLSPWDSLEDRVTSHLLVDQPPTRSEQPQPQVQALLERRLSPSQPLNNLIHQGSQSTISQLSDPGTPISARSRTFQRSPSPCSDKEPTPPDPSNLTRTPPRASWRQPNFSDKEVLPSINDTAYRLRSHQQRRQPQERLDHYTSDPFVNTTKSSLQMDWFRRHSRRAQPARNASVLTIEEKRTLEPFDQLTGVTSQDEKQALSSHESSLSAQISRSRTARVNTVVDLYIEPLLHEQASNGLNQSTFVLVPEIQNPASASEMSSKGENYELPADIGSVLPRSEYHDMLVGFPSELNVQVVRLHPAHSGHTGHSGQARDALGDKGSRFWQQPAVRHELDRLLKIRLVDMGLDVIDPAGFTAPFRKHGWTERGEQVGGTPNVATVSPTAQSGNAWGGNGSQAGLGIWQNGGTRRAQSSWGMVKAESLLPGQASVRVSLEDVCFRVQSDMGLFNTRTDKAIIVRVAVEI